MFQQGEAEVFEPEEHLQEKVEVWGVVMEVAELLEAEVVVQLPSVVSLVV